MTEWAGRAPVLARTLKHQITLNQLSRFTCKIKNLGQKVFGDVLGGCFSCHNNWGCHLFLVPRTRDADCLVIHRTGCHNEEFSCSKPAELLMRNPGPRLGNILGPFQLSSQAYIRWYSELNVPFKPLRIFQISGTALGFSQSRQWLWLIIDYLGSFLDWVLQLSYANQD